VRQYAEGSVVLPVASGARVLPELARRLAAAGITIADLTLRRPTLDDVFLSLTGRPAARAPDRADPGQDTAPGAGAGVRDQSATTEKDIA
jgi:hypothetical protein